MPFITVRMLEGRTLDQKRDLVKAMTEVMERTCGAKPENTMIVIQDVSEEMWAKGGLLIAERD